MWKDSIIKCTNQYQYWEWPTCKVRRTEEWPTQVSTSFEQEHKSKWWLNVGSINSIYKTGTSLWHKRHQQRLHRDWKLNQSVEINSENEPPFLLNKGILRRQMDKCSVTLAKNMHVKLFQNMFWFYFATWKCILVEILTTNRLISLTTNYNWSCKIVNNGDWKWSCNKKLY